MRLSWTIAALICLSTQVNASVEQSLTQCKSLSQDSERLACYDKIANNVRVKPSKASIPVTPPVPVAAVKPAVIAAPISAPVATPAQVSPQPTAKQQVSDFGIQYKKLDNEITKVFMDVAQVTKNPRGLLKVTFENGQIWKQTESRRFKLKKGDKAFIEKASLGSFLMGTEGRNATIRVKRLK